MAANEMTPDGYIVHHVDYAPVPFDFGSSRYAVDILYPYPEADNNGRHMYIGREGNIQTWWVDGRLSRFRGAAYIGNGSDGNDYEEWYQDNKLHRDDGPAIVYGVDMEEWYLHGKRHREGGPAVVESDGSEVWYENDQKHRIGGPAVKRRMKENFAILTRNSTTTDDIEATPDMEPGFAYQYWYHGKQLNKEDDDYGEKLLGLIYPDIDGIKGGYLG